jgi:hypothetical protein
MGTRWLCEGRTELECDGVHVGEEDMPYAEARRLLGHDRIVGVTAARVATAPSPRLKPVPIMLRSALFSRA